MLLQGCIKPGQHTVCRPEQRVPSAKISASFKSSYSHFKYASDKMRFFSPCRLQLMPLHYNVVPPYHHPTHSWTLLSIMMVDCLVLAVTHYCYDIIVQECKPHDNFFDINTNVVSSYSLASRLSGQRD